MKFLPSINTPAYVADELAIARNLQIAARIKSETGCTMLLATKAFSMFSLFPLFASVLDGTTASGLYEARLGHEHFGGEVHAYSPAFSSQDIAQLRHICHHISFNSVAQLSAYGEHFPVRGLRLNPRLSLVKNNPLYDPSSSTSRFGVALQDITPDVLMRMNLLHVHNLCENMATDSVKLIQHLMDIAPHVLDVVNYVNIGGGHYFTHPGYDTDAFIAAINRLQHTHKVRVIVESGGTYVYQAGYLVASVVDIVRSGTADIAILDCSATCHMPDVLEVPYRPDVLGDSASYPCEYILAGNTCLTGDIIGKYRFATPLASGDKIVFCDMMQYSMVKNTTFNGVPLPDIGTLSSAGDYRVIKSFGYGDFKNKLS